MHSPTPLLSRNGSAPIAGIAPPLSRSGINLAGAEFGGEMPGIYGVTYTYPTAENLDYHAACRRTLIRLPFRWERIQPALGAPLKAAETDRLFAFLDDAHARGMHVILDVHNYGRYVLPGQSAYAGAIIGSPTVPRAAFADLWRRLAESFGRHPAVCAYGLMNEPHDMEDPVRWPQAAQAAIDAIRAVDMRTTILVPGDDWASSRNWRLGNNEDLAAKITDPAENIVFEAHCYFDADNSGTYKGTYDEEGATPDCGIEYVRPFVQWCRDHGVRGFLGEYGIPDTDTRWLVTMDRLLAYLQEHSIGSAYWAGGPWWHEDPMAIEPRPTEFTSAHRPQMLVLRQYPG